MSRKTKNFLFLHGGPGLNSYAEKRVLGPCFQSKNWSIKFWNEPSLLRSDGDVFTPVQAFRGHCESARKSVYELFLTGGPVHVIAHSFATHTAMWLASHCPDEIEKITFIGPSLNLSESFQKIFRLAVSDLKPSNPELAESLIQVLENDPRVFDEQMHAGFNIALQDAALFGHYWQNTDKMAIWAQTLTEEGGAFDLQSFFAVLEDLGKTGLAKPSGEKSKIPVQLIFGEHDPVILKDAEISAFESFFSERTSQTLLEVGHFPHLEAPEQFMEALAGFSLGSHLQRDRTQDGLITRSQGESSAERVFSA